MTTRSDASKIPVPAIAAAALTAVIFWSLKPVLISIIGDKGGYAEVYIASGTISTCLSLIIALAMWRTTRQLLRGGPTALKGALYSTLSGLFLALWYYGFYRALYGTAKVDATVIAFSWPLIAVVAMRVFAPSVGTKLRVHEILLMLAAFGGAGAIGIANLGIGSNGVPTGGNDIIYAFVAAIGSGLYLPFAILASGNFHQLGTSRPTATFYSIALANAVSLAAIWAMIGVSGQTLRYNAFDGPTLAVCALIGIGTYLIAEITWTWAFQEYNSLTLSSLPYFSPAVSVVLLHVFFGEAVRPIAVVGLLVILFSNLTLHANYRSANALTLSLVATVYVALAAQVLPSEYEDATVEMAAALTGLFAILAGFILSRASERRTRELDARSALVQRIIDKDLTSDTSTTDSLLRDLVDLEYDTPYSEKDLRAGALRSRLLGPEVRQGQESKAATESLSEWVTIHRDRLSLGEQAALWATGLGSILYVLLLREDTIFGIVGPVVFASGALLTIFTIKDYDRNNINGFRNQVWRMQQGFRDIGRSWYVPAKVLRTGEGADVYGGHTVRTVAPTGELVKVEAVDKNTTFRRFYLATAVLVLAVTLYLPWAAANNQLAPPIGNPRPGAAAAPVPPQRKAPLVVADPGWSAGSVLAEVIRQSIEDHASSPVEVRKVPQISALQELSAPSGTVDIHPDLWVGNQPKLVQDELLSQKKVTLNDVPYPGTQGIYISDDGVGGVTSLGDLTDRDNAQLFDSDGDGKGEIWVGEEDWESTARIRLIVEDNFPNLEAEAYSERIFKARLEDSVKDSEPLLFYGYRPDWIHQTVKTRSLQTLPVTQAEDGCWSDTRRVCQPGTVSVHVAHKSTLTSSHPKISRFLGAAKFNQKTIGEFIRQVEKNDRDPQDVAAEWLTDNDQIVDGWWREP